MLLAIEGPLYLDKSIKIIFEFKGIFILEKKQIHAHSTKLNEQLAYCFHRLFKLNVFAH